MTDHDETTRRKGNPMTSQDIKIDVVEDRPLKGMWHCGPNAAWVTATHLPTMISARMFDQYQHKARDAAIACVEMMVEQSRLTKCQFPERITPTAAKETP